MRQIFPATLRQTDVAAIVPSGYRRSPIWGRNAGPATTQRATLLSADDGAHLNEQLAKQPRDLHLASAEILGDLRLGPLLEEPQLDQSPLVVLQLGQSLVDDQPRLGAGDVLVGLVRAEANPTDIAASIEDAR